MGAFDDCFDDMFDGGAAVGDIIVDALAVAPTAALAPLDHVAAGLARLPQQWRNKIHMIDMLRIFLGRYNDLEAAYQDLLLLRSINTANSDDPLGTVGDQLDKIGAKVGQRRNGLNNDDYRRYCRARIRANNSNGRVEDLIAVSRLILNDSAAVPVVTTQAIATAIVEINGVAIDDNVAGILVQFLRIAVAGGVRLQQITHPGGDAGSFALGDAAAPSSDAATGLGDATELGQPTLIPYGTTGTTGGRLSDVRE